MKSEDTVCPVCEKHYFKTPYDYSICPICGWENDGFQRDKHDSSGGANSLSVNESKKVYFFSGISEAKPKLEEFERIYKENRIEVYQLFKGINHMTAKDKMWSNAHRKIRKDFMIEVEKLYNKYNSKIK